MKSALKTLAVIFIMLSLIPLSALMFYDDSNGKFKIYDEDSNKIQTLSPREYVIGAVCCEMPPSFHKEALKAQAAAIYTNAVRSSFSGEDFVASVNQKNFKGYADKEKFEERWGKNFSVYYEKICTAVDEVLGAVITYDGKPIVAAYHSLSSGSTESAENVWGESVPYLVAVTSEGDTFNAELTAQKTFTVKEARKILSEAFPEAFLPEVDTLILTEAEYSPSGTLTSVMVGNEKTNGQKLRALFSLRSAAISFEIKEGNVTFTTKGYGHAVGLSQYGADFMARQGADWKQILAHYYKGSSILYTEQE
ncbi:MAG: stage II sporulation protein D [Oscillospiraceae bacterium]|nr:stage II sporulation protein D [Oscillospiraceae bacterium]